MTDSQKVKNTNENASGNVSLYMGLKMIGIAISSYFGGLLLEYVPKKQIFIMTGTIPLLLFFVAFFLPEKKFIKPEKKDEENLPLNQ